VGEQLAAVADAQYGHAQREDLRIHLGRACGVNAAGASGEDDADGVLGPNFADGHVVGFDLAVHIALADAAGNQLIVLAAEVQF
jgi:hypothetical protein